MNSSQKALELVRSYLEVMPHLRLDKARECAIIAAKEAMHCDWYIQNKEDHYRHAEYWTDVIKKIKNLIPSQL